MKFPATWFSENSTWYLRSANGSSDGQAALMFGESENTLFTFGRQDLRYKIANYTTMDLDNDTMIRNNSITRINALEGKYEWGYVFGNGSANRFFDIVKTDYRIIMNLTIITNTTANTTTNTTKNTTTDTTTDTTTNMTTDSTTDTSTNTISNSTANSTSNSTTNSTSNSTSNSTANSTKNGPDYVNVVIFVYGNRNYGRIIVRGN